jgi:hypothetical protein
MDILVEDLSRNFDSQLEESKTYGGIQNPSIRKSRNAWIPTTHWIGGLIWNYIEKANKEIFQYNLDCIDGESMQYTHYGINEHYAWHQDEYVLCPCLQVCNVLNLVLWTLYFVRFLREVTIHKYLKYSRTNGSIRC